MTVQKMKTLSPLLWNEENSFLSLIDQRALPYELKYIKIHSHNEMAEAIQDMVVRGAPAIGIAAAYGVVLAAQSLLANLDSKLQFKDKSLDLVGRLRSYFNQVDKLLRSTRPTAVNLMWALDRQKKVIKEALKKFSETQSLDKSNFESLEIAIFEKTLEEAKSIHQGDIDRCKKISEVGANYIKGKFAQRISEGKKLRIMTHCNAGALATGGYGTALGVVRKLHEEDLVEMIYSNETRPRQQGARLTVWELAYDQIPVTLVADTSSAHMMKEQMIDLVIVGSDRIAANGDLANKIGTYQLAISASYHDIPFYVAAPMSTVDMSLKSGGEIPIELRSSEEISHINAQPCTVIESLDGKSELGESSVGFYNPAFDVCPAALVEQIFTEDGLFA